MATRTTKTNVAGDEPTATPATAFPAPMRQDPAPIDERPLVDDTEPGAEDPETDEQREAREASEADQLASNQSGFAQRAEVPAAEVAPVVPAALNAATLDGMPVPFDRTLETVVDPHSGAIVSVPVDRDDKPADEKSEADKKDEGKA